MATNYSIKFFKKAYQTVSEAGQWNGYSGAAPLSAANDGNIYFDSTTGEIWVGGVCYGGGAIRDVNYSGGVLTITKSNGSEQTLDFNDVASAQATLQVFQHMNNLIGVSNDPSIGTRTYLDYSGTHYISGEDDLVGADKALDTAIYELGTRIDNLDGSAVIATKTGNVVTLKAGVSEDGGVITNSTDADITLATVAATGAAEDVSVSTTAFVSTNVKDALVELKDAITGANITIDGHKGTITSDTNTMIPVAADGGKIGVKTDNVYIGSSANGVTLLNVDTAGGSTTDGDLATVLTVKTYISTEIGALNASEIELATITEDAITISGIQEVNGIISASGTTTIPVDGTVSSENPLLTQDSLDTLVNGLDVEGYVQGTVTGSTITVYGIKEEDGKIGSDTTKNLTIALEGTYNASTNKVALESTVTNAIEGLDVGTIQPVEYTAPSGDNGAKLTFHNIAEQDGEIMLGTTGGAELQFAKVATSGEAVDVTLAAANTPYVGSNVDETIVDVDSRIKALEQLPTFDTVVCSSAADTPENITWGTNPSITGTLVASNSTMHKIYLVPATGTAAAPNTYAEYITVNNSGTYSWEKVGDTATDLTGYVKTITVNGKEYAVTSSTTNVALGNVVTSVVDGDSNLPTTGGYTSDYIETEVVTSTLSTAADGTRETTVTSAGAVKVQAVGSADASNKGLAEASDVKTYVGSQIEALDVELSTVTGTNVAVSYSETDGKVTISNVSETYATVANDLTVTTPDGLVKGSDIETVKTYIGSRVQDLDKESTTADGTNVHVTYSETDGIVTINSVTEDYATVQVSTTAEPSLTVTDGTKLAVGSDIAKVKEYVDAKISTSINALDATVTSDDAAVATVQVVETNGLITDVVVTNVSAGVSYTAATTGDNPTDANLSATTTTGAVTGADIATIKQYIDAKADEATAGVEVEDAGAVIPVGTTAYTTLGTVNGTAITAKVSYTWEEYE